MTIADLISIIDQKREVLPPSDLEWFEREIGSRLPEDYRQFLLSCGGGDLNSEVTLSGRDCGAVSSFLGLEDLDRRLLQGYDLRSGTLTAVTLPVPMLPVAYTESGDPICFCLDHIAPGAVYLIDHDCGGLDVRKWERGRSEIDAEFRVAESFTDFVGRLSQMANDK
ncbi:MAG: SMI1/KNR4 family protein [Verrucomicrobiaceae bacterium]|nr:SMI1/KNR4 family protein [Verrucomicrobiaceae bacterium]